MFKLDRNQLQTIYDVGGGEEADVLGDYVFILGLEPGPPDPRWSIFEVAIDTLVRTFQPAPTLVHVELFLPRTTAADDSHFATYYGERAGWGNSFRNQREFYLGVNAGRWRAIPVCTRDAARRLRKECENHVGTPYSLARYLCAVPPLRSFAPLFASGVGSGAHCATLSARCLKRALPEISDLLHHSSNFYGPSTLSLALTTPLAHSKAYAAMHAHVGSDDDADLARDTLLTGTDEAVAELRPSSAAIALRGLALRASQPKMDPVTRAVAERQLATALLRWDQAKRPSP